MLSPSHTNQDYTPTVVMLVTKIVIQKMGHKTKGYLHCLQCFLFALTKFKLLQTILFVCFILCFIVSQVGQWAADAVKGCVGEILKITRDKITIRNAVSNRKKTFDISNALAIPPVGSFVKLRVASLLLFACQS